MGSRRHSQVALASATVPTPSASVGWLLFLLALGALAGIAGASYYLSRSRPLQQDDPDAPLFI